MLYATSDRYGCWFGRAFEETIRSLSPGAETVVFERTLTCIPPSTAANVVFFFVCDDAFGPHDYTSSKVLTHATEHLKPDLAEHVPLEKCIALRGDTQELRETIRLALRSFTCSSALTTTILAKAGGLSGRRAAGQSGGGFVPDGGKPLRDRTLMRPERGLHG